MDPSQQENDQSVFIQKLENELTKYKSQNKKLKKQVNNLAKENQLKDQQLDGKSKCIINCISENLRLKQQIDSLKKQAELMRHNANNQRRNKLGKKPNHIELMKRYSFDSNQTTNDENVSINNQMPYFMPSLCRSVSASSNLSEVACKISFPSPSSNVSKINQNNIGLSPIAEINPVDININAAMETFVNQYAPITPITVMSDLNCSFKIMQQSDNNSTIHQDFADSVATISTTPSPKSIFIVNATKRFNDDTQIIYTDEEFSGSITAMTPSYISLQNNSENAGYDKSITVKSSNKNYATPTILNILDEDQSENACNSISRLQLTSIESYISIID